MASVPNRPQLRQSREGVEPFNPLPVHPPHCVQANCQATSPSILVMLIDAFLMRICEPFNFWWHSCCPQEPTSGAAMFSCASQRHHFALSNARRVSSAGGARRLDDSEAIGGGQRL